jgi:hypothetical protein
LSELHVESSVPLVVRFEKDGPDPTLPHFMTTGKHPAAWNSRRSVIASQALIDAFMFICRPGAKARRNAHAISSLSASAAKMLFLPACGHLLSRQSLKLIEWFRIAS